LLWKELPTNIKSQVVAQETSISDSASTIEFLKVCEVASKDVNYFSRFRSNVNFCLILEHTDYWRGKQYASKVRRKTDVVLIRNHLIQFDSIGTPIKYKYRKFPNCSPSVLRYLSVYYELNEYFGDLTDLVITEIGVGYGGQATIIGLLSQPKSYNLFDLPEVLNLTTRFILSQAVDLKIKKFDGRDPLSISTDLVISNYAFSELSRQTQLQYLHNVLLKSKMGYITWNTLAFDALGGLSIQEMLDLIPGSEIVEEIPLTANGNLVLLWGRKQ
jgi:hypothetical protein